MNKKTKFKKLACCMAVAGSLCAATQAQALAFNLTSTGNANADAGFQRAAAFWMSKYSDPVTVNINAGFAALDPNVLGQAGSANFNTSFANMKGALTADATSAADATMVAGLPGGSTYSRYINGTSTSAADHLQTGITAMRMTSANAKAIGLLAGNNAAPDAEIIFSSNFNFDFDQSDGIGAGLFDFVGIAIHELGHAMGFTSGVDILDFNSNGPGVTNRISDAQYSPFTTLLDFTRCSAASQAAGADMDWRIGTAAKDFAIDGNCTAIASNAWSTGVRFGDGRQASHWKDNLGWGIMDPTAVAPGSLNVVTNLDLLAFDVIGWNNVTTNVPEPGSLLLVSMGLLGIGALRRRRQTV